MRHVPAPVRVAKAVAQQLVCREVLQQTLRWCARDQRRSDRPMNEPRYVTWIVGAAGGIGRALLARRAAVGDTLVLSGRDASKLDALEGAGWLREPLDARSFDATLAAARRIIERFGRLDAVVNLAGSIVLKPASSTSEADFQDLIDVNLKSAFSVLRAAATVMTQGGSVVLMSSAAAAVGLANHEGIAAAKAGVEGLVRSAAATYAARRLRVNAVAPGLVDTPLAARILANEASRRVSESMHPLGRVGQADEVASAIDWLLGPEPSWITGQVIRIDGGLSSVKAR
jgi:NAD(P)-dependent dehydrogenase (short-subunit alcohol dehydrogenase family)